MEEVLVGRGRELAAVTSMLDRARERVGGLLLLTGEAGIGKTRLTEEIATHAAADGFVVWWASCFEDEGVPAYWVWAQLLRALAASRDDDTLAVELGPSAAFVLQLVPELSDRLARVGLSVAGAEPGGEVGGGAARLPLFEAVVSVFRRAATRRPVVLVLDDLQWADASSLALLRFAAREVRPSPIMILATLRDVGAGPSRAQIPAGLAEAARTIALTGLDDSGVAALAEQVIGQPPARSLVETLRRQSGGNPLFVIELSRLLTDPAQQLGPALMPAGTRAVIERRLDALSASCRRALAPASVLGVEVPLGLLAEVTDAPADQLIDTLREAVAARLLVEAAAAASYWFAHALVREALYESLLARERSSLHRKAADALERRAGAPRAAELAHHFRRAGEHARAVSYAEAAGHEALAVQAYEEAVAHFEQALSALDLTASEDGRRVDLLLALGDAHLRSGDLRAARAAFVEAAAAARRRGRADELAHAALGFGAGLGGFEVTLFDQHQITLLEDALQALGSEDSPLRAWTLARLSVALAFVAPQPRRRELSEEAVGMARRLDDRRALAYALASHCDALAGPAHSRRRLGMAEEIVRLAERERDPTTALLGRRLRLVALLESGDIAGVDAEIEVFARAAEDLRQPLYLWYVPLWRGMRALMQGRLDDAQRHVDDAAAIGARASSVNAVVLTDSLRIELALERGQPQEAEALLRGDVEEGLPLGPSAQSALASILARQGRRDEAEAIVDRLAMGEELPVEDGQWLNGMCRLADAAAELRAADACEVLYERLAPYADRFAVDGIGAACLGSVHRFLGRLAEILGRAEAAAAHFDAAVAAHRRSGASLLLAHTRRERGDAESDAVDGGLGLGPPLTDSPGSEPGGENVFRRDGDTWTVAFAGREVRVSHAKGLRDIAVLLATPGREVPVADLVALDGGTLPDGAGTGPVLDGRALAAYRTRLADLREELEEAEQFGDPERASRAKAEIDLLAEQLGAAIGLGGRPRRGDDPVERARKAVTRRIRHTIRRLAPRHPALAGHLEHSIRTGRFCSYAPERPTTWIL